MVDQVADVGEQIEQWRVLAGAARTLTISSGRRVGTMLAGEIGVIVGSAPIGRRRLGPERTAAGPHCGVGDHLVA